MTQARLKKIHLRLPPQGLMMQMIAIVLLPLLVILLAITFGSVSIHQKAMRMMVGERDARAVNAAAKALSAQVDIRVKELDGLAQVISVEAPSLSTTKIPEIDFLIHDFDRGLGFFDAQGNLLLSQGDQKLWQAYAADPAAWRGIFAKLKSQPGKITVITSPLENGYIGLTSSMVNGNTMIIAAFSITSQVGIMLADTLPTGSDMSILLVDQEGHVLFQAGAVPNPTSNHPGIAEALQGKNGVTYVKYGGDEHVTAYSPVASAGWALITEESWEAVSTPTLTNTQVAPLVLVPALLIMFLALWLGARQVVQPLRTLEAQADKLAGGDFAAIQEPVKGIAEIQHLQQSLADMAQKVQDAQRSLHRYIGSITAAQEDERRRLARELHDDTLQALIALKQRVQLTQLELQSAGERGMEESSELNEIATLTEQTIENLRRLTRALRPIYLEDLGLVPALEMLSRETGQTTGIPIEFNRRGTERRLDADVELALYRIAQEALSNITRHAQAKHASVSLNYSPSSVTLKVADDGVGFSVPKNQAEYAANGHYGLLGLRERAELIGAGLEIITAPGKGTVLNVTLPV